MFDFYFTFHRVDFSWHLLRSDESCHRKEKVTEKRCHFGPCEEDSLIHTYFLPL